MANALTLLKDRQVGGLWLGYCQQNLLPPTTLCWLCNYRLWLL